MMLWIQLGTALLHQYSYYHMLTESYVFSLQVQTALHAFDVLQKPAEIQRVNSNSEVYDKKLCSCIFIADEVEVMLGVDISKLDVKCPTPESKPACEPAQPAPKDSEKHAHAESKQASL